MPGRKERSNVPVQHPRYLHLPNHTRSNTQRFARAADESVLASKKPNIVVCDYA